MKITLCLRDLNEPGKHTLVEVEMPALPHKGDCIRIGKRQSYEVSDVVYDFDDNFCFTGQVIIDLLLI